VEAYIIRIKEKVEALVVAYTETGVEISADKTKHCSCLVIRTQDKVSV
jgi:hypothetical protein